VPGWDQKLALAKLRGHWQTRFLEVQPDDHARLNLVVAGRTAVLQLL
jgi:hypothetical protein